MNIQELVITEPLSLREVYSECFGEASGLADGWERLCNEWPIARRISGEVVGYLGTQIRSHDGPLVCNLLEKAVLRYCDTKVIHNHERLYEFVMGVVVGVRALPNFKLSHKNKYWVLGEHCSLPRWLRNKNLSEINISLYRSLSEEKAQMILGYILEENVMNWVKNSENKVVRLMA